MDYYTIICVKTGKAVLLVGHGASPTDCPGEFLSELKKLEMRRKASGGPMSAREAELDRKVRDWPRTPETDPYQAGVEAVAAALRQKLKGREVAVAYNEFCAPTIEEAIERLIAAGARGVTVITTMFTRGGVHSETEIPEILEGLRKKHPAVDLRYAWPFALDRLGAMLADQVVLSEK